MPYDLRKDSKIVINTIYKCEYLLKYLPNFFTESIYGQRHIHVNALANSHDTHIKKTLRMLIAAIPQVHLHRALYLHKIFADHGVVTQRKTTSSQFN